VVDINQTVAGLKGSLGLPTQDVNTVAAPSTATGQAPAPQNTTPVQQAQNAQQILASISQPQTEAVAQTEAQRIMAAKDKALEDTKAQIEQLTLSQQSQTEKIGELLEQLKPKQTQQGRIPAPTLPGLPEGFDDLPANEQVATLKESFNNLQSEVANVITKDREGVLNVLGPMGGQLRKYQDQNDKVAVETKYPNFGWDAHKADIDKIRAELPGIQALEAAELIGHRVDPNLLTIPEPSAPVSMGTIPSQQSATGAQQTTADQSSNLADTIKQLQNAIVTERYAGRNASANQLTDALLKAKLGR